jgi:hypothetical protein
MTVETILWRRLDATGFDSCRLAPSSSGWTLDGTAVFVHNGQPARLAYRVVCDSHWRTKNGVVCGWAGKQFIDLSFARDEAGVWRQSSEVLADMEGLIDLDLGFTPATNTIPIRRLALSVGQAADASAAWFDLTSRTMKTLPQRYERVDEAVYAYEAPGLAFSARLDVTPSALIRRYPGLWEMQAHWSSDIE